MRRKPDYIWYKLNIRGLARFNAIKETVKKYNPTIDKSTWYRARRQLALGIAPPEVRSLEVEIDGHFYHFSQRLHFDAFETSWVKGQGFVTRPRLSRVLKSADPK